MSPSDCVGVPWSELVDRIESGSLLARWAEHEPCLATIADVAMLVRVAHGSDCRSDADEVLAALVRRAASDGGNDLAAALLLCHLLANGTRALAIRLRDLSCEIDDLIAGALWIQIRTFPWQRRRRAIAQNLLLDTRRAVLQELCPHRRRDGTRWITVTAPADLADASSPALLGVGIGQAATANAAVRDLADLLDWALTRRVIAVRDARLLLDLVTAAHRTDARDHASRRGLNVRADVDDVAARWGTDERTVRRRRDRALLALRNARDAYLSEVA